MNKLLMGSFLAIAMLMPPLGASDSSPEKVEDVIEPVKKEIKEAAENNTNAANAKQINTNSINTKPLNSKAEEKPSAAQLRISELLKGLTSYQAHFKQRVFDSRKRVVNQNTGVFSLARPNRFRWHVKEPYEELIIANGSELWAVDFDLDQITVQTLSQSLGDTPALLLARTDVDLGATYNIRYVGSDAEGRESYQLVPKDSSSLFEYVNIVFKKDTLEQLRLKDSMGQTTAVLFDEAKVNPELKASLFEFKPDPNMDFIDSRESTDSLPAQQSRDTSS